MFCKEKIAAHFSTSSCRYDLQAHWQRQVASDLMLLVEDKFATGRMCDLGAGTGFVYDALTNGYSRSKVIPVDIAFGMANFIKNKFRDAQCICADADLLPFANDTFQLVTANLMLQWSNDIDKTMTEIYRVVKKGGKFIFSTLGPRSLYELKQSYPNAVHEFMLKEKLLEVIKAKFSVILFFEKIYVIHYRSAADVLYTLQQLGVKNVRKDRKLGLLGKNQFQQILTNYEAFRQPQGIPVTYQVYFGVISK